MSDRSVPEAWSVDPTLRFDHIHIIESLDTGFAGRSTAFATSMSCGLDVRERPFLNSTP